MSGSVTGGKKAYKTMVERYGVDENGASLHHKRIGALGGKKGITGGFYSDRELARRAGAKGGKISRRGKKNVYIDAPENREIMALREQTDI
jgi:general stress protein YciG